MYVQVTRSSDPDCPAGRQGFMELLEAKAGRGRVRIKLPCDGHEHVFTERAKGDVTRVRIQGPGPKLLAR